MCRLRSIARSRRITARAAPSSADRSQGRVLIVDDVITAGTAIRESIDIIRAAGAHPAGVLLALDRQERGSVSPLSAVQEVREQFGMPVLAVISLTDLMQHMRAHGPRRRARAHAELPGPLWPHRLRNTPWKTGLARGSKWRGFEGDYAVETPCLDPSAACCSPASTACAGTPARPAAATTRSTNGWMSRG